MKQTYGINSKGQKQVLKDPILEELMKQIAQEKPSDSFTRNVMDRIPEAAVFSDEEKQSILGFTSLLVALFTLAIGTLIYFGLRSHFFASINLQNIEIQQYIRYILATSHDFINAIREIKISSLTALIFIATFSTFAIERILRKRHEIFLKQLEKEQA